MLKKNEYLFEKHTLEEINRYNAIPFMLFTNLGKPFTALGESMDGYNFLSPYFIFSGVENSIFCANIVVLIQ